MEVRAKIIDASGRIAAILKQLEADTGERVDSIELRSLEVTTMTDTRRRERTHVVINMAAPTVREWGTS